MPDQQVIRRKRRLEEVREQVGHQIRHIVAKPEHVVPFLRAGRMIRVQVVSNEGAGTTPKLVDWGWGIFVSFS